MAHRGLGLPIDDAYIFLCYAGNLAAGHGFSFNPGETSFGGTSLLWPVLIAGVEKIAPQWDPISLSFLIGYVLFIYAAMMPIALVEGHSRRWWAALCAGVMVVLSPYQFMNAVSGMETPLTLLLVLLLAGIVTIDRPMPLATGILAGLLTLNRPESLYFGPVAAALWIVLALLHKEKGPRAVLAPAALMVAAWAVLVLPAAFYIHAHTGSFLPTTYLGKIIAGTPDAFNRPFHVRLFWSAMSLGDGWVKLAWPLKALAPVLAVGIIFQAVTAIRAARRSETPLWPAFGWVLLCGYLFLPGVYGFSFPVHPPFGGYYVRYIAPVQAVFIVVGMVGVAGLAKSLADKYSVPVGRRRAVAVAGAAAIIGFQGWLWSFQFPAARKTFTDEVRLNAGLRREAGLWLRDHVRSDEKIMVGYTGLGVVGYYSDRYCLDVGALINPDIFPYYRGTGYNIDRRREAIIQYMIDRGATWYVSFAYPRDKAPPLADPTTDPRFLEAARLGAPGEPKNQYEQIRVYRFSK